MSNQISMAYDQAAALPLYLTDGIINLPGAVPTPAAAVTDPTLVSASISEDGSQLVIVPVGQRAGSTVVTVSSPNLASFALTVNITAPVPNAVGVDVTDAVLQPYVPTAPAAAS